MKNNLIYGLVDPRNDMVCYVGKTTLGLNRPITHLHYSHNELVRNWVNELNDFNLFPSIYIIEENIELSKLSEREFFWINKYYSINSNILNKSLISKINKEHEINRNLYRLENSELDFFIKCLSNASSILKSVRFLKGVTQQSLSEKAKIARSTLTLLESTNNGNIKTLLLLLNELNKDFPEKQSVRRPNRK
jgi:DNA-binding XRE family transcriptional regulator